MKKLIDLLLFGHSHVWEETERNGVEDSQGIIIGYAVMCKCTKCGTPKRFNLY